MKKLPIIPNTEIIGCGTDSGVKYCEDACVYSGSDSDCLDYRIRNMKVLMDTREQTRGKIKLAFKKYRLLKSNVMPESKLIPMPLSKKLYERCIKTCHPDTLQAHRERMNDILSEGYQLSWATYVQFGKYTIVELVFDGKHYHGLAAQAPCDMRTTSAGIAVAYKRAFENMLEDTLWH